MTDQKETAVLVDYITGKTVPDIGAEANRQAVERKLVEEKGFDKSQIDVDTPFEFEVRGEKHRSKIDLTIRIEGRRFMVIKCAAGSLGSREREIISAARLLDTYQIPFAAVSDGKTIAVLNTVTGKKISEGFDAFPGKDDAGKEFSGMPLFPLPRNRVEKEQLIFRSYDSMNVNRQIP